VHNYTPFIVSKNEFTNYTQDTMALRTSLVNKLYYREDGEGGMFIIIKMKRLVFEPAQMHKHLFCILRC